MNIWEEEKIKLEMNEYMEGVWGNEAALKKCVMEMGCNPYPKKDIASCPVGDFFKKSRPAQRSAIWSIARQTDNLIAQGYGGDDTPSFHASTVVELTLHKENYDLISDVLIVLRKLKLEKLWKEMIKLYDDVYMKWRTSGIAISAYHDAEMSIDNCLGNNKLSGEGLYEFLRDEALGVIAVFKEAKKMAIPYAPEEPPDPTPESEEENFERYLDYMMFDREARRQYWN